MGIRTIAKVLPFVAVAGAAIGLASCKDGGVAHERRDLQRARQQYQNDSIMLANITKADSIEAEEKLKSFENFIDENELELNRSDSTTLYCFGVDYEDQERLFAEAKVKKTLLPFNHFIDKYVLGKTDWLDDWVYDSMMKEDHSILFNKLKANDVLKSLEKDVDVVRGNKLKQSQDEYEKAKVAYEKARQDSTDIARYEELSKEMDTYM